MAEKDLVEAIARAMTTMTKDEGIVDRLSEDVAQRLDARSHLIQYVVPRISCNQEEVLAVIFAHIDAAYLEGYDDATFSVRGTAEKTKDRGLLIMARELEAGRSRLTGRSNDAP